MMNVSVTVTIQRKKWVVYRIADPIQFIGIFDTRDAADRFVGPERDGIYIELVRWNPPVPVPVL